MSHFDDALNVCRCCGEKSQGLLRRDFLKSLLFGLTASGLSFLAPRSVFAAEHRAKALVLSCIDFRFISIERSFLQTQNLDNAYDWVALAGASLVLTGFPHTAEAETFWDQLALSKKLHHIEKVIIMDHQDCGAYANKLGVEMFEEIGFEQKIHGQYLSQAYQHIKKRYPDLAVELYFAQLDGEVIPVMPQIQAT